MISKEEKRLKNLLYSKLYRQKRFNIKNNITQYCDYCKRCVLINPIKPHHSTHWILEKRTDIILFD